jgi:L-alanine-DL-glutamate epimerase-like enolase superfamily enzyme
MKIKSITAFSSNLQLTKPYAITGRTISHVENIFTVITLENGIVGIGAANPAPEVVGETPTQALQNLQSDFIQQFIGRDIRHFKQLIFENNSRFPDLPGTQAAFDIALHDAFAQYLGIPIVELYGQKVISLPTSITIGIMNVEETMQEAENYIAQGFSVLKVKTGENPEEDTERILKLYERFGSSVTIRVDANQGYSITQLKQFMAATRHIPVELVEQPLPRGQEADLFILPADERKILAADESLKNAVYALQFAQNPKPYGIYNIKLMKCGGISGAMEIAGIAKNAGIELFWGCNDESIVSITAALHAAFACDHTRYIDLDGSFDLARDMVTGGFILQNGRLMLNGKPGLGVERIGA